MLSKMEDSPGEMAVIPLANPLLPMIEAVIKGGVTEQNVAALDKLLGVYERLQDKDAERRFAVAFVALQSELQPVQATKAVPNKDQTVRYKFAPYEEIMEVVRPLLQKHGFTVTFSMTFSECRVIQNCTLQHVGGHSRTNQFAARVGHGPPNSSEAQGDGAASTYAKRFAFCNALNITVETDSDAGTDARNDGDVISPEKAQYLREQVKETASDEPKFLELAGAKTYEEIREGAYPVLVRALARKGRK